MDHIFTSPKDTQPKVTLAYRLLVVAPAKIRNQSNLMLIYGVIPYTFARHFPSLVLSLRKGNHHRTTISLCTTMMYPQDIE
jgi:hypothetical protein